MHTLQKIYRDEALFSFGLHLPFKHFHATITEQMAKSTAHKVALFVPAVIGYVVTGILLALAMPLRAFTYAIIGTSFADDPSHFLQDRGLEAVKTEITYSPIDDPQKRKECVQTLIEAIRLDEHEYNPLAYNLLEWLVQEKQWDVSQMSFDGKSALAHLGNMLYYVTDSNSVKKFVSLLAESGVDVNKSAEESLLCRVIRGGINQSNGNGSLLAMVEALIEAGADVNATDGKGMTPLNWVMSMCAEYDLEKKPDDRLVQSYKPIVEALILAGADHKIEDRSSMSAIGRATEGQLSEFLEMFQKNDQQAQV